jgi:hypothetical protein
MMIRVCVKAKDYSYYGEVVGAAVKRSGLVRFIVEDENGRLFIHSHEHLGMPEPRIRNGFLHFEGEVDDHVREVMRNLYFRLGKL